MEEDEARAVIGQYCMTIMDMADNMEVLQALAMFRAAASDAAQALQAAGHSPGQAASLLSGMLLLSWNLTPADA